jgi:hypothetical protein
MYSCVLRTINAKETTTIATQKTFECRQDLGNRGSIVFERQLVHEEPKLSTISVPLLSSSDPNNSKSVFNHPTKLAEED